MSEKNNTIEILDLIFKNSSEPYTKGGKRLVDRFDVKDFVVNLTKDYKLTKK